MTHTHTSRMIRSLKGLMLLVCSFDVGCTPEEASMMMSMLAGGGSSGPSSQSSSPSSGMLRPPPSSGASRPSSSGSQGSGSQGSGGMPDMNLVSGGPVQQSPGFRPFGGPTGPTREPRHPSGDNSIEDGASGNFGPLGIPDEGGGQQFADAGRDPGFSDPGPGGFNGDVTSGTGM